MAYFDIQLILDARKLVWPAAFYRLVEKSFAKRSGFLGIPKAIAYTTEHQLDVMRRQHTFDQDEASSCAGSNSRGYHRSPEPTTPTNRGQRDAPMAKDTDDSAG